MYHHPYYYTFAYYQNNGYARPYPEIDTSTLSNSIEESKKLADDSLLILDKLSDSSFAHQVMSEAQQGHQEEVDNLLNSITISSTLVTHYTPSGIRIELFSKEASVTLTLYLQWGY